MNNLFAQPTDHFSASPRTEAQFSPGSVSVASQADPLSSAHVRVSVVIPCLNEAQSLAICIDKAVAALQRIGIEGEVVVADNGSTDGSVEIAGSHGARVVHVNAKG